MKHLISIALICTFAALSAVGCDMPIEDIIDGEPAPVPLPEPEPEQDGEDFVVPDFPIVSIGAGLCGNGVIDLGEQCDCGAEGGDEPTEFCQTFNGPDSWCSDDCQAACTWSGFTGNLCAPAPAEINACIARDQCAARLELIEAERGYQRCLTQDQYTDADCLVGRGVQRDEISARLGALDWFCRNPGHNPDHVPANGRDWNSRNRNDNCH